MTERARQTDEAGDIFWRQFSSTGRFEFLALTLSDTVRNRVWKLSNLENHRLLMPVVVTQYNNIMF